MIVRIETAVATVIASNIASVAAAARVGRRCNRWSPPVFLPAADSSTRLIDCGIAGLAKTGFALTYGTRDPAVCTRSAWRLIRNQYARKECVSRSYNPDTIMIEPKDVSGVRGDTQPTCEWTLNMQIMFRADLRRSEISSNCERGVQPARTKRASAPDSDRASPRSPWRSRPPISTCQSPV